MAAIDTAGTTLSFDGVAIGSVQSISGMSLSRASIDTSALEHTAGKEFIASGLYDSGELSFEIQYDPGSTGHDKLTTSLKAGTDGAVIVTFSDSATWTSAGGHVTAFEPGMEVDGVTTGSCTIKISGAVTIA